MSDVETGKPAPAQERPRTKKQMTSESLFEGAHELLILHAGEEYRLRITKNGKLILTK